MKKILLGCLQLFFFCFLRAQNTGVDTTYNPHELFTQDFDLPAGNVFRSAKGIPGSMYWQNEASYLINATFVKRILP